jgi:hypothetical protein
MKLGIEKSESIKSMGKKVTFAEYAEVIIFRKSTKN